MTTRTDPATTRTGLLRITSYCAASLTLLLLLLAAHGHQLAGAQGRTTLRTDPARSTSSVAAHNPKHGLSVIINPTTFQLTGPITLSLPPKQRRETWEWESSQLSTLPDSFIVFANSDDNRVANITIMRPEIDFAGGHFTPNEDGNFTLTPSNMTVAVASIQGILFDGQTFTINNQRQAVDPDDIPEVVGNLQQQAGSLTLKTTSSFKVPYSFWSDSDDSDETGHFSFDLEDTATGSYPGHGPPTPYFAMKETELFGDYD